MIEVVFASSNPGKIRELTALLAPYHLRIIPQTKLNVSDVPETGLTFVENALIKARHACERTGLPAIADDSGIEVAALQGAPGIYSARYAGEHAHADDNIKKLLHVLEHESDRRAAYQCTLVFLAHAKDPTPLICQGTWYGEILSAPKGQDGFGYDPVFFDPEQQCSAAELPLTIKNRISHRAHALQDLLKKLPQKIGDIHDTCSHR